MQYQHNVRAEYVWIDGQQPTAKLRSKTKILDQMPQRVEHIPDWGFDGSSTAQAKGNHSDLLLKPVYFVRDPLHDVERDILVLCEVMNVDGTPHWSNTRARCRDIAERYTDQECWFGIEQEYTLYKGRDPLGWPNHGFPAPQGGYYCGVGADEVYGRDVIEEHTSACLAAGIRLVGTNAEVMPAQWEFQLAPMNALEESDQLWLSRWLLYRIGEKSGINAKLDPKPVDGDWNGAGAHTNFSTKAMREPGGLRVILEACEKLKFRHQEHIAVYGADNDKRLTGKHETCSINEFRSGVFDRGASIRIPLATERAGCGYLEDRRPAANMDPYRVTSILMETICGKPQLLTEGADVVIDAQSATPTTL